MQYVICITKRRSTVVLLFLEFHNRVGIAKSLAYHVAILQLARNKYIKTVTKFFAFLSHTTRIININDSETAAIDNTMNGKKCLRSLTLCLPKN